VPQGRTPRGVRPHGEAHLPKTRISRINKNKCTSSIESHASFGFHY
jgi:hypothetical protein